MQLTLMRHGIDTVSGHPRGLTSAGRAQVERITMALAASGWRPASVVHSPLLRARETADVVLDCLGTLPRIELEDVVGGNWKLLELMADLGLDDPLIIGHEPGISVLARRLVGAEGSLPFGRATVASFEVQRLPPIAPATLRFFVPAALLDHTQAG